MRTFDNCINLIISIIIFSVNIFYSQAQSSWRGVERTGFVGLLKADPEKFDLISSFKISKGSGPYWAHPVIYCGKLYIRHGKVLMAFNTKK